MEIMGNGRLITRDGANPFIEDGAVAFEGDSIVELGTTEEIRAKYKDAGFLDAHGGVIMPGLINAHNHIYSAFARGLSIKGSQTRNFLEILDGQWWTIDRNLTLPDTRGSADAFFIEAIENGCTTMFDHHAGYGGIEGSLFAIEESAKKMGVRVNLCYEISDREGEEKFRQAVKENVDFIEHTRKQNSGMSVGMMGMHAAFTLSDKSLEYCVGRNPQNAGYHIHVSEGIDDVYLNLKQHGKTPAFRLFDFGILGEHTLFGHCTHVTEAEIDLIAQTKTMVGHNPESNMGNAIGCPPVLRMYEKGVLIGLGTDGYTNDMIESYKVGNILHKHALCDPTVAWGEIPDMLFINNAAMATKFFGREIGVLKTGAAADIIALDYQPPTPMTKDNLNSHILFGMNGRLTTHTVINGKLRMKDRRLIDIDKQKVLADCRQQAQDLWTRINKGR